MSTVYRIPGKLFSHLTKDIPTTKELGGYFHFNDQNIATGVELFTGKVCRDDHGKLLDDNKPCEVHFPQREVSFHTHPLANRPSSDDFLNCLSANPTVRLHMVLSRGGVWMYRVNKQPTEAVHANLRSELRFLGHFYQADTQHNRVEQYIQNVQSLGFWVKFIPKKSILNHKMYEILLTS